MMELETKSVEVVRGEVADDDHGDPGREELRAGCPCWPRATTCGPWQMVKSVPVAVAWMVPGTTVPSRRKVWVPSVCRWARAWSTVSK